MYKRDPVQCRVLSDGVRLGICGVYFRHPKSLRGEHAEMEIRFISVEVTQTLGED